MITNQLSIFDDKIIENFSNVKVREFEFSPCRIETIAEFVEKWHYSKNVNGIISDFCFMLTYQQNLVGAAIFGKLAMANAWRKYVENERDITELRRLVCVDLTKRNTESNFIGRCLRWLGDNTNIKIVISYADRNHGHVGTIYKATNFEFIGLTSP